MRLLVSPGSSSAPANRGSRGRYNSEPETTGLRFVRHLIAGLLLLALIALGVVAFSLYNPLAGGPRVLSRSQLIAPSSSSITHLITGEAPVQVTDPPQIATLALRYQPTLVVSADDRFWPVSVLDSLRFRFDGHATCLYRGGRCRVPNPAPSDLDHPGSWSDFLAYPAPLASVGDAFFSAAEALGIPVGTIRAWTRKPAAIDPFATAQIYFYYLGRTGPRAYPGIRGGLISLEYWFYYPLNYFPLVRIPLEALSHPVTSTLGNTDYHQGDLEHVAVLLDPKTMQPLYLWMARHANEGQAYPWHSTSVQWEGDHPVIYAALGSHTSYARCGIERRPRTYWFINDYVVCAPHGDYGFTYETTPLVDLTHTAWACWRGHLGISGAHLRRSTYRFVPFETDGPHSPLLQAENFHTTCKPKPGDKPPPQPL